MKTNYRHLVWILLVLASLLACNAFSGVQERVQGVKSTVGAVVTQAEGLATAVTTVQALATEAGPVIKTAQAYATQNPGIEKTAIAIATQAGIGEMPADIPILPKEQTTNLFSSREMVTYSTSLSFNDVKDFYEREMPQNGWQKSSEGEVNFDTMWVRNYSKAGKKALVTIMKDQQSNKVTVAIVIESK